MGSLIEMIDHFLRVPGPLRAVVFGLLLSWSGTQALKFVAPLRRLPDPANRSAVRAIAFVLAWLPVAVLWPGPWPERLLAAVTTALCAPTAYTYAARIAYHFWPWLEPHVSAQPRSRAGG